MPPPETQQSDSLETLIGDPGANPLGIRRGEVFRTFEDTRLRAVCDADPAGLPGLVGADAPFDAHAVPGGRVDRLDEKAAATSKRRRSLRQRANRASSPVSSGSLAPASNRRDDSPWRTMNAVTTGWPSSSVPCTVYSDEPSRSRSEK